MIISVIISEAIIFVVVAVDFILALAIFFLKVFNFWLRWVFVAVRGLSLVAVGLCCCAWAFSSCSERGLLFVAVRRLLIAPASHCGGFSLRWLLLLKSTGSRRPGFRSCGSRALEHRLSSCGTRA